MDVALVTCARLPDLDPDDVPLLDALRQRGLDARPVVWDDPAIDWSGVRLAVLRSPWDYHLRQDEFLGWAARVSGQARLLNPLPTVRWNSHKGYMRELAARGAPVTPTVFLDRGTRADLAALCDDRGWVSVVVKPSVSADSWRTVRASRDSIAEGQAHLDALLAERDAMVQPFLASVETHGERCLVFIDGELSHAIRKRSLFQGGRHAGPEGIAVDIAADEAEAARQVLALSQQGDLLYARVDLTRDEAGAPLLMELELLEPTLFLLGNERATARLADAVQRRMA
jgi:hypothetical protein